MIYSIGHSTLTTEQFTKLIKPIQIIIDVRSHPTSKWPQYNLNNLIEWIPTTGHQYQWWPELGGWSEHHQHLDYTNKGVNITAYTTGKFPKQHIAAKLPPTNTPTWTNQGLYDYSWFMSTTEFLQAIDKLIQLGNHTNIGIMCAEILWFKCHRSMIADYLWYRQTNTTHLQPKPTNHSKIISNRLQRYHPEILTIWNTHQPKNS